MWKFFVQNKEVGLDEIKKQFKVDLSQFEPTPEPPKPVKKKKKKYKPLIPDGHYLDLETGKIKPLESDYSSFSYVPLPEKKPNKKQKPQECDAATVMINGVSFRQNVLTQIAKESNFNVELCEVVRHDTMDILLGARCNHCKAEKTVTLASLDLIDFKYPLGMGINVFDGLFEFSKLHRHFFAPTKEPPVPSAAPEVEKAPVRRKFKELL